MSQKKEAITIKFKPDYNLFKLGLHITLFATLIALMILGVNNLQAVLGFLTQTFATVMTLLSPVFIALGITYILDPLVRVYHVKILKKDPMGRRPLATGMAFISVIIIVTLAGYAITISLRGSDGFRLVDNTIRAIEEFTGGFAMISDQLKDRIGDFNTLWQGEAIAEDAINTVTFIVERAGAQIIRYLSRIGGYVINIVIGIVVSFYFLADKQTVLREWRRFLNLCFKTKTISKLGEFWKQTDFVLSGYIRGQMLDVVIMSVLISLVLIVLRIDYAIIIGIISGFANLIPMVGSIVATIIAALVALAGDEPIRALYALIALIILQQIDGNIIVPKVVGKSVNLHPMVVVLSLFIFGSLFGILGMLVAVPVTALLKHFYFEYAHKRAASGGTGED